jgi:intracellular sulfur oxidation DsrE/DsrF family protein
MRVIIAVLAALLSSQGAVLANEDVDALLARSESPHGVVFEIVEADEDALEDLLPLVRNAIEKIRARFPGTEFAVVSHGREEFALQTRYQDEQAEVHQQVQALVAADVPVHVCETHAGWYGVTAEDFPDYVNVAPTGPGQVQLYEELGYELIVVE